MRITGTRTRPYELDLTRKLGDANSPHGVSRVGGLAVFIDTDEGLTGVSVGMPGTGEAIRMLGERVIGKDPRGVRGLWKRMADSIFKGGNEGDVNYALAAIDVALWDLKAKANGEPLWKTLGASSRRVKAYASGIDMPLTDDELQSFYEEMAAEGVNGGKLKVGLDIDADLRRLGIVHEALKGSGKKPLLAIDSNEYWSPKQAIRHVRAFEDQYDIAWCEEPARRWDYRGLRKVSQNVRAAVATGENLGDIGAFMSLIANEAVDIVQVLVARLGITGALQVADMAYGFELPVSVMNAHGNLGAHLAAALPNHMMMEVVGAGREAAMRVDNRIEDGYIVLGDSPGLGIEYDEEKLDQLTADSSQAPGTRNFIEGRRRGAGLYEAPPDEPDELDEE